MREFYIPPLSRERDLYGSEFEIKLRNELSLKGLTAVLAENLRHEYGASYNKRNLEHFRKFYLLFNDI